MPCSPNRAPTVHYHPWDRHARGDQLLLSLVTKSDKPVVDGGLRCGGHGHECRRPGNIYNGVAVVTNPGAKGKGTLSC